MPTPQPERSPEERKQALMAALRRELKRRGRLLEKVKGDLARSGRAEEERVRGELLKAALPELRRGLSSIEVVNYFQPDLPKLKIELDPALSPQENVAACFKRYRKARRARPIIERRLLEIAAEEEKVRELLLRLERRVGGEGDVGLEELEAVEKLAASFQRSRPKAGARPAGSGSSTGHSQGRRRFLSLDGYEILVGRSAKENDELTLRVARGNDLFLHVAGKAGAHVIVRTRPGKSVPPDTLLDAAQLAVYHALNTRERHAAGAVAVPEGALPAADVDYTHVKNVRKGKGAPPGLVFLLSHKTLRVRLEPERLARLFQSVNPGSAFASVDPGPGA